MKTERIKKKGPLERQWSLTKVILLLYTSNTISSVALQIP
jgi:hypothetical protein